MFGLKESGFVISLGVTLLLIGLVAYYVRQRTTELETKFDQIFKLVQMLNTQTSKHQYTIGRMLGEIPSEVPVNNVNIQPTHMEDGHTELDVNSNPEFVATPQLIPVSDDDGDDDSDDDTDDDSDDDTDGDSDDDNVHQVVLNHDVADHDVAEHVKIIDLNNETQPNEFDINVNDDNGSSDKTTTNSTPSDNMEHSDETLESSINLQNLDQNADYGKMNVKVLKEIAQQKGIDIKGKKKGDLVELLSH